MDNVEKLVIIGSGPAGLTAAIYAARGNLDPLVITGETVGGLPTIAPLIEDYPGFPEGVVGLELVNLFRKQAEKFEARFLTEKVESVDFKKEPFEIKTASKTILAKSVILATGSNPIWLNLPSEQKLIGRGVSACAVCDGPFFRGKKVVIVGGGDSALKEAIYLSKIASEVTIIHRRDELRAQEILQEQIKAKENIKLVLESTVEEVSGEDKVTGVKVKNISTGEISEIDCEGVFIAIGHKPATEFLKDQLELDAKGFIVLKGETETSVQGVFAAGDVADPRYRQVATSVGSGTKAALDAEAYLEEIKI